MDLTTQPPGTYRLPPPPDAPHLEFVADHLDYDRTRSMLHLKGNVRVQESTWTLKGDELWIDTERRRARSQGFLLVEDGASAVYGDSGEFDFAEHSGILYNASAGLGDWRVHAKSMSVDAKRRVHYRDAKITSCNYNPPHYYFYASRATVYPGDHLTAQHVRYTVGKVPLFYVPFLYKSLSKTHFLRFRVQPGYDRRNGAFVKSTLTNQHSATWRSKLFLDYYAAQGFGAGGELHRRDGEDSRGVLTAYRIRETLGTERWSLGGDLYQGFASSFSVQARMQVMSDPNFNNDYARSSFFPVTPNLINNGALVYRLPRLTTRLSYSRQDDAVGPNGKYYKTAESAPRLDLNSAQLKFWRLPWLNTLSGSAENNYTRGRPFLQKSVNGSWQGTRVFTLGRGASFTPSASYSETYYDRNIMTVGPASTTTFSDVTVGRYAVAGTLRLKSLAGSFDLTQTYAQRLKTDSLTEDAGALDHGVEANMLSAMHAYRPHRKVFMRLSSAYDFRVFRDHGVGFRDRVQPIVGELIYTPRPLLNFNARDDYQLARGNRSFIFNGSWGDPEKTYVAAGVGYNLLDSSRYFLNTEFGLAASSSTWHVIAALRSQVDTPGGFGGLRGYQVFQKELTVIKHWHDFFTRVGVRFRPGNVQEGTVRVEMKFGAYDADRQKVHDWESEWFPERAKGVVDRP